jgi:hypothetical protein
MAKSLLAAVHDAVAGGAEDIPEREETGAQAPLSTRKEEAMSKDDAPAGGDKNTGISQAEHDAAVKAANETGRSEGVKMATDRFVTALGSEGVKGDAGRMSAAIDLAMRSPAMSGEDVAAFVVANVAAARGDAAAGYEKNRLAAAGLAQPVGGIEKKAAATNWADFRAKRNPAG